DCWYPPHRPSATASFAAALCTRCYRRKNWSMPSWMARPRALARSRRVSMFDLRGPLIRISVLVIVIVLVVVALVLTLDRVACGRHRQANKETTERDARGKRGLRHFVAGPYSSTLRIQARSSIIWGGTRSGSPAPEISSNA